MTKPLFYTLFFTAWIFISCNPVETDLALDDLNDRQEITGTLVIDANYFKGSKVEHLLVNGRTHKSGDILSLNHPGYYRIEIFGEGTNANSLGVLRIALLDKERGEAEWGLNKWTPLPPIVDAIDEREVTLIHAPSVPPGMSIPLVVRVEGAPSSFAHSFLAKNGSGEFYIKKGVGSVIIPSDEVGDSKLVINHRTFPLDIQLFESSPLLLQNALNADLQVEAGTYVSIEKDLTIPPGISLIINEGAFIAIAPEVNIYNEGILRIKGSPALPVTFTCSDPGAFWGGIISTGSGNQVDASHAIFSKSGFHTGGSFSYGHAWRQALIYSEQALLDFDHCYMIDHVGQIFYPVSSTLNISSCLVQRAMTGGQINSSELTIRNSIFTDFPDDSQNYQDRDNDALYLMGSNAIISNSFFMYAKDDGLDSGGSSGGSIEVINSHFEAVFHEGAALSSGGSSTKYHHFTGCTFTNCGQGLELGYSSPNHLVTVDSCLFQNNGIGIRYGDNYTTPHHGRVLVSNSKSLYNAEYDVWNMLRENWSADTSKMEFMHVTVSMETPMYPHLTLDEAK